MTSIIAIGGATTRGGYMENGETRPMDEAAIQQTGEQKPNIIFLPTARGDSKEYTERFHSYFRDTLGCNTDVLELSENPPRKPDLEEKIEWADAVYAGGGATSYMLNVWRSLGLDEILRTAWETGTVMFGISAGALCWTNGGLQLGTALEGTDYGPLAGLGFVDDLPLTVHATPEIRARFAEFLDARDTNGVALENNTAIEITGDEWRIITSSPNAFAYHVQTCETEPYVEPLPADGKFRPLSTLRR